MNIRHGIYHFPNFRRRQFLKVNKRSVGYSQNILKTKIGASAKSRVTTTRQTRTERYRDIKIPLMNKRYNIKSTLRSQLNDELCKPITDHKYFVEVRDNIELLINMVEMANCLPYKEDDHTTAIQFIDAQLERINSQAVFGREQDILEMIRVLHAARLEAGNGKDLGMKILLIQVGEIFKPEEEAAGDEDSLQATLSANVRRPTYENRGMAVQDRKGPKKNPDNRSPNQSSSEISKLIQAVFDMPKWVVCTRH